LCLDGAHTPIAAGTCACRAAHRNSRQRGFDGVDAFLQVVAGIHVLAVTEHSCVAVALGYTPTRAIDIATGLAGRLAVDSRGSVAAALTRGLALAGTVGTGGSAATGIALALTGRGAGGLAIGDTRGLVRITLTMCGALAITGATASAFAVRRAIKIGVRRTLPFAGAAARDIA